MTNGKYIIASIIAILTTQPIIVAMQPVEQPRVIYVKKEERSILGRIAGSVGDIASDGLHAFLTTVGRGFWRAEDEAGRNIQRLTAMSGICAGAVNFYLAGKCHDEKNKCWLCGCRGKKIKHLAWAMVLGGAGLALYPGVNW